jgi:hypothetical protein
VDGKYVDLKVAGYRRYTVAAAYGASGADQATAYAGGSKDNVSVYVNQTTASAMGTLPTGTESQQAIFRVTLRFNPIYLEVTDILNP